MKKGIFTKALAMLLSLMLLCTPLLGVMCSAAEVQQTCPVIKVHGFMAKDIYADPQNPDSDVLWPPKTDDILSVVKDCIPSLAKFFVTWNWDTLGKEISPKIKAMLSPAFCTSNGTVGDSSGVRFQYPDAQSVTKNGTYEFCYDWRIDPLVTASKLNDFINYILTCSGSDKVSIICHSLGGVITLSYLTLYGDQKIQGVCFNATAIYGETYNGELMTGKLSLNADAITSYMKYAFDANEYEYLLNGIFKLLNDAGILDLACRFGNLVTEKLFDYAVPEVVVPMFGNWLTIWSMVPDCDIEAAIDNVFDNVYKDSNVDRSVIKQKIESYNTLVRSAREQTLKKLSQDANIVVISRYGYSSLPITPSWKNLGDGVIDAKYSSFGAFTAQSGETLTDEYLNRKDLSFVSPSKNIDATPCLFPQKTWFISDMGHGDTSDILYDMAKKLLFTPGGATVETYAEYPRFIKYSKEEDTLAPDTADIEQLSGWQRFVLAVKQLFAMIKNLFLSVFSK